MSVRHKDLPLRKIWLHERAKEMFGSDAGIVRAWPTTDPPSRSAVSRWLNSEHPNDIPPNQLLAFAAALNVDPLGLFEFTPDLYAKFCSGLARRIALAKGIGVLFKEFGWAHKIIAPDKNWPPEDFAKWYSGRLTVHPFSHAPKPGDQPFFQKLRITATKDEKFSEPQVWHFAYQTVGRHPIWRPYGFVKREQRRVELHDFQGRTDSAEAPDATSFVVETCFGLGPANFRVASLHPFCVELVDSSREGRVHSSRCVRFA